MIYILVIVVIAIVFLHIKSFLYKNNKFEILQINSVYNNEYTGYFRENLPIIISSEQFIFSPTTLYKSDTLLSVTKGEFFYHTKDRLFIHSLKDDVTISICNPTQLPKFKVDTDRPPIKKLSVVNNSFNYIQIIVKKGMVLSVPRFWIFTVGDVQKSQLNIKMSDTPISILLSKFI